MRRRLTAWLLGGLCLAAAAAAQQGDPARGRALLLNRRASLCLLCHSGPFPEPPRQGDLAPSLSGAGTRYREDELRARISDPARFNADSIMPAFGPREGRWREGAAWQGRAILSAQQISDLAAFLATLRD